MNYRILCPLYKKKEVHKRSLKQWIDFNLEPIAPTIGKAIFIFHNFHFCTRIPYLFIKDDREVIIFTPHFIIKSMTEDEVLLFELIHHQDELDLLMKESLGNRISSVPILTKADLIQCENMVTYLKTVRVLYSLKRKKKVLY
jgi:hypothetical protein